MTAPAALVVIVAFRADAHLERCLDALHREFDVLVVDNDDSAATRAITERAGAGYRATADNVGFATAVNVGLAVAGGRDVLLLNPDALVEPDDVRALQAALHDPAHRRAAVGPRLVDAAGRPEPASWPMPSPRQVWADAVGRTRASGARFVTGAVLLLRADAVAALGGFDERYFLYAEEADWQRRALDAGWEVAVVEQVVARHVGAASSGDRAVRDAHFRASGRAFARRWYGPAGVAAMRLGTVAAALRRAVVGPDRAGGRRALRRRTAVPGAARPSVVHVVRSDSFAGVERSVADVAAEQHRLGWRVTVIGGDPVRMRQAVPAGVATLPAVTTLQAWRALRRAGRADVVHAHMTAAELAVAAGRRRGARRVTTRHFAAPRGSGPTVRAAGRLVAGAFDAQVAISGFVADAVEGSSVVVANGVAPSSTERTRRSRTVVVLQRWEQEKHTDLALRAWALSGLADAGWRLVLHGRGSQEPELRRLADDLGVLVEFAGFTDDPRAVLAGAAMLLATAPAEPFGLTVAEAMAEGTPVVAADGGAHREVLGPDGRYFVPGDVEGAAAALVALASAPDRAAVGARLRRRQRALFSVQRQVDGLLSVYRGAPRVALLSLEPWDDIWRRNQHLASRIVASGAVAELTFVTPPRGGLALRARRSRPAPGIEVVIPPLVVPRRLGGHRVLGAWLRRALADADVLWVNDAAAGVSALRPGVPAVYDVTDDWRSLAQAAADTRRIVAAEDVLATRAATVVCSDVLADRWRERYGVDPAVVPNGVDLAALRRAVPQALDGPAPHAVYVGTVHPNRVDVDLVRALALEWPGTVHLVGPHALDSSRTPGVRLVGAVPARDVPGWLVAADVLMCPHVVDAFTLSLDAIKAHEYLATDRPVVATPTSGFQSLRADGLVVTDAAGFVEAAVAAVGGRFPDREVAVDWDVRAARFAEQLLARAVDR